MKHYSLKLIRSLVIMIGVSGIASLSCIEAAPRGVTSEESTFFSNYVQKVSEVVQKIGQRLQQFLDTNNRDSVSVHINEFETLLLEIRSELIVPVKSENGQDASLQLTCEILQEVENAINELITTIKTYKSKGHLKLGIELKKVKDKFGHLEVKVTTLSQSGNKDIEDCVNCIKHLARGLPTEPSVILNCLKHRLECR